MGIQVLVVEDEAEIANVLIRELREDGFTVEHAGDGDSAWLALRTGSWDLVLLDWWLPTEDGLSLLRRFRQVNRETPVLFLTARDGVSDRVRGLDSLRARLHEIFERQHRFTGDASHQLRMPLAAMLGQVEVPLRPERSADDDRRVLALVRDQAAHLSRSVETILFS